MTIRDYLVLGFIILLVLLSVYVTIKRKRDGKGCGGCSGCSGCSIKDCHQRNEEYNK